MTSADEPRTPDSFSDEETLCLLAMLYPLPPERRKRIHERAMEVHKEWRRKQGLDDEEPPLS